MNSGCPFCDGALAPQARFCSHCGNAVPSPDMYHVVIDLRERFANAGAVIDLRDHG